MSENSYHWSAPGGNGDGAASFTRTDWSNIMRVVGACMDDEGIAPGLLNALAGSVTGANAVSINSGGALVDGKPYYNGTPLAVNIPSAAGGGNTRIDRIVLRADWAGQTVRITRIAGVDAASPTAPAITQTTGVTYDVLLYQALVNTSGTVTLTDERVFAQINTANGIAAGVVGTTQLAALAVTTAKLALNSVDDTIAGDRVPQFYRRQGGSATDWSIGGSTARTPTSVRIQAGVTADVSLANGASTDVTVTFPVAFSQPPVVVASATSQGSTGVIGTVSIPQSPTTGLTASQVQFHVTNNTGSLNNVGVSWIAVGPE